MTTRSHSHSAWRVSTLALCIYFFLSLLYSFSYAQQPPPASMEEWLNERVVFLPQPRSYQPYAYSAYSLSSIRQERPSYENLVGRSATILRIHQRDVFDPPQVTMELDGTDTLVYGFVFDGHLSEVGFLREMLLARRFIGTILWNARNDFFVYDSTMGTFERIYVHNLKPLYLQAVEWGKDPRVPLHFVFRTISGGLLYWNGSYTDLNSHPGREPKLFTKSFYTSSPRLTYTDWSDSLWALIEEEQVSPGMTADMVTLSWGEPVHISAEQNGAIELWTYDREPQIVLRFERGILQSWYYPPQ